MRAAILIFLGLATADLAALRTTDLQMVTGQPWIGTLTYLDYRSDKPVSIRSTLIVSRPTTARCSSLKQIQRVEHLASSTV